MIVADTKTYASDVAFTDTVKAIQARKGSRPAYARMEAGGSWEQSITADLKAEIEAQTSVFLATANADGQPYIQHRGGPAGFLRVLDEHTIGFVDFAGNRQYITQGNLEENPKAQLFLIDYAHRRRIKVWGTARVVEGDEALLRRLMPAGLSREAGAGRALHRHRVGRELPAAHSAALRGGRCGGSDRVSRRTHRRAGGRGRALAQGWKHLGVVSE